MAIVINGTGTIAGVSATGITTAPTNATDASKLPLAGGALTGNLVVGGTITQNKSGDSMYLNRTSDDGNILRLQREGSTKAALGVTSNNLTLEVGGTTRMTITSGGNVGIGCTPTNKFTVQQNGITLLTKSNIGTAAHEAGGGFQNTGHATQGNRNAIMWLDADGANFGGSDYYYIQKTGGGGVSHILQNAAEMTFATSGSNRMFINSRGNVKIGGGSPNVINTSFDSLQVGAGGSISSFYNGVNGAGTDSSELLDDYEEGESTITLACSDSGSITLKSTHNKCLYTKIGRLVSFNIHIRVNSVSSPSGGVNINGLPFAAGSNEIFRASASVAPVYNFTSPSGSMALAWVGNNSTSMSFAFYNGSTQTLNSGGYFQTNTEGYITGSYMTD